MLAPRPLTRLFGLTVLSLACAAPLLAEPAPRPLLGDSWPLVGFDRQGPCALTLRSNPLAVRIDAAGLIPGETLRLTVRNGAMKPLQLALRASAEGTYRTVYAPLKSYYGAPVPLDAQGGQVDIVVEAARCTLAASSPWQFGRPVLR